MGNINLIGHSMGGKIAITYAQMWPNEVNSLISLDSPPVDRN